MPEYAPTRQQRDRSDHQRDLQEDFAQIEAIRFAVREREFPFEFVAFGLKFLLVLFIRRNFGANLLLNLGRACGIFGLDHVRQIGE